MRHRRRFLNVVTRNWLTGAHSLHRIDLHSSHNNLFYPTAAAAEEATAAAAQDPSVLFGGTRRHVALEEVPEIRIPAAAQSFMQRQLPSNRTRYDPCPVWCVALSESETVFLDGNSLSAFLYDAKDRCVVTLPELHESKRFPVCLSVTSTGDFGTRDDTIYVMDRSLGRPETPPSSSSIQLQALVHSKMHSYGTYLDNWRCDELPPPPYVASSGGDYFILSHALLGGGGASDVICVSTSYAGTYCFYMATRTWSKAGDWALSFEGKIERYADLGVWIGFLHYRRKNEFQRLCVTGDLFAAADRRRVTTLCHDKARLWADDGKDLEPPHGWYQESCLPKIVSLGSGKFCLVQFFETREEVCREEVVDRFAEIYSDYEEEICGHYGPPAGEVVDKFAVFTGVEMVRGRGGGGKDGHGDDEQGGNGSSAGGDLRIIVHKSKRYMLTDSEATIAFVL